MRRTFAAVSIIVVAMLLAGAIGSAPAQTPDEAEIRSVIKQFDADMSSRNGGALLALYVPDPEAVYFEEVLPLQIVSFGAFRKFAEDSIFKQVSRLHQETQVERIKVDRNLAVAVSLIRVSWTDAAGEQFQTGRFTQVFSKVGGKWLIWHEHYSVPFDQATGKAIFDAKP